MLFSLFCPFVIYIKRKNALCLVLLEGQLVFQAYSISGLSYINRSFFKNPQTDPPYCPHPG